MNPTRASAPGDGPGSAPAFWQALSQVAQVLDSLDAGPASGPVIFESLLQRSARGRDGGFLAALCADLGESGGDPGFARAMLAVHFGESCTQLQQVGRHTLQTLWWLHAYHPGSLPIPKWPRYSRKWKKCQQDMLHR